MPPPRSRSLSSRLPSLSIAPVRAMWSKHPRLLSAVAAAVGVLGLAVATNVIGGDDAASPEAQVRQVVQRFGVATARKDYQEICDELIARSLSSKVEALGLPCESAFKRGLDAVVAAQLTIESVRVKGDAAFAQVHSTAFGQPSSDDTLQLVRVDEQWKIASLTAENQPAAVTPAVKQPAAGKPAVVEPD